MNRKIFLIVLFLLVLLNFIMQVPYYIHQYYLPFHTLPSVFGTSLLVLALTWFILAIVLLAKKKSVGYYLIITFLAVEFLFYLMTQVTQALSGHGILLYVLHPTDLLLAFVFGVGYINFVAAGISLYILLRYKRNFVEEPK